MNTPASSFVKKREPRVTTNGKIGRIESAPNQTKDTLLPTRASSLFVLLLALFGSVPSNAQSINLGRGELPLTVPDNYDANIATPLIVLLHGFGSNGPVQDAYLGFSVVANANGFLLISPTGKHNPMGTSFWNATPACCDYYASGVDDIGYIIGLIDAIKANYNVDERRVYLVGHSNGGFMSYQVAYSHPSTIAAIVSLAGASHNEARTAPVSPVHVLQIHGDNDGTILYGGGYLLGSPYPGGLTSVVTWAGYNGCSTGSRQGPSRDLVANLGGNETSSRIFDSDCKTGGSAELWTMVDGVHVPDVSATFAQQVVDWLYAHTKSEWPAPYNGVTPDPSFALEYNNIASFHIADETIYACLRIYSGGVPGSIGGISEYDIGFGIVSVEQGILRVSNSRPFNTGKARNENNELPACSGIFETTTNTYTDIIQAVTGLISFL